MGEFGKCGRVEGHMRESMRNGAAFDRVSASALFYFPTDDWARLIVIVSSAAAEISNRYVCIIVCAWIYAVALSLSLFLSFSEML